MNQDLASRFAKKTNTPLELITARLVRGYNQQLSKPITLRLKATLNIGPRRFPNTYLYLVDGLACDLILGRKWLGPQGALLDVARNKVIWPDNSKISTPETLDLEMNTTDTLDPEMDTTHRIALIGASAYSMNARDQSSECFAATPWEVERILYQRENALDEHSDETEAEMLRRTVPKEYHDLIDVFSKVKADALPPHRESVTSQQSAVQMEE